MTSQALGWLLIGTGIGILLAAFAGAVRRRAERRAVERVVTDYRARP